MESTLPAWIAAGCSLIGAFGIAWWNGRFTGSVNTRLCAIEKTLNGQMKEQFDSATEERHELKAATEAVALALAEKAPECTEHRIRLKQAEDTLKIVIAREERQRGKGEDE